MTIRSTLQSFSSMREAYAALLSYEADYLRANKRKATIELTLASTSKPLYDQYGRMKLSNEVIEVRAVYDEGVAAQIVEYEWFAARAVAAS